MPFWIYISLCSNIYFFYLRWNLPKIASVVEFAFPTGVFFISFGKKSSPRELIVFLIRILWNQSTGTNSREMVSSAWSLLIACFQNFFVKALSKKTSWTWWSCLVWLQSSRHHLCLTWSILYHVNWGPHRKSFVKWSHHPLILVLCMSTSWSGPWSFPAPCLKDDGLGSREWIITPAKTLPEWSLVCFGGKQHTWYDPDLPEKIH